MLVGGTGALSAGVTKQLAPGVSLDWTRGLLLARAAAVAALTAPSPELARVGAERKAKTRAEQLLKTALGKIPLTGLTWKALRKDKDREARLTEVLEDPLVVEVEYASDGTTVVTLGVPLAALRDAIAGSVMAPPGGEGGVESVLLDARGVVSRPVLNLSVGDAIIGPAVYVQNEGEALSDPRLGKRMIRARTKSAKNGRLQVEAEGPVAGALADGALFFVIVGTAP